MTTILAALGLLAFLAAVYVAYRLSRTTIGPAYIEVTEQDDSFLRGDFPQPAPLSDFQRSVDAGFVELPDFTAERRMRRHGSDAFERSVRRTTIRHINTRGEL